MTTSHGTELVTLSRISVIDQRPNGVSFIKTQKGNEFRYGVQWNKINKPKVGDFLLSYGNQKPLCLIEKEAIDEHYKDHIEFIDSLVEFSVTQAAFIELLKTAKETT